MELSSRALNVSRNTKNDSRTRKQRGSGKYMRENMNTHDDLLNHNNFSSLETIDRLPNIMPEVPYIEPGPDTFRILLTTDNHVGYLENDAIRGDDSWKTFSEIMQLCYTQDIDFVLQGGDLFHYNKPSKKSYYHVMRILRENCWGNKPREFKLVSDPSMAINAKHFAYPIEFDENVNVGVPVYAISGNHDDATGEDMLSPLDLLAVGGLLNHFGRVTNNDNIDIIPLLFNKGKSNIALYGLQSIREERLKRTMASGNLQFLEPDTEDTEWFNLFVIHQNHVQRPGVKIVEEVNLPEFLDFVLWGHEHECFTRARRNELTGFSVLQAGSSVATSLSEGEIASKHVFVLSVKGKDYSLEPIRLRSVRPFAMKDLVLSESGIAPTSGNKDQIINYLINETDSLIEQAVETWKSINEDSEDEVEVPLPIIRLRVEYSGGYEVENPRRFSNRFVGKVANINDIVLFYIKRQVGNSLATELRKKNANGNGFNDHDGIQSRIVEGKSSIVDFLDMNLKEEDLILLKKDEISKVVSDFMIKEDKNLIKTFVDKEMAKDLDLFMKLQLDDDGWDQMKDTEDSVTVGKVKSGFKKLLKEMRAKTKAEAKYIKQASEPTPDFSRFAKPTPAEKIVVATSDDEDVVIDKAPPTDKMAIAIESESDSDDSFADYEMNIDSDKEVTTPPVRNTKIVAKPGKVAKASTNKTRKTTKKVNNKELENGKRSQLPLSMFSSIGRRKN